MIRHYPAAFQDSAPPWGLSPWGDDCARPPAGDRSEDSARTGLPSDESGLHGDKPRGGLLLLSGRVSDESWLGRDKPGGGLRPMHLRIIRMGKKKSR